MEIGLEGQVKATLDHFRVEVHSVRSDLQQTLQESSEHRTDILDLKARVDALEDLNIDDRFISLALEVRELQEKIAKFILGDSREPPELRVGYDEVSETYSIGPMEYFTTAVEDLSVGSVFKLVLVEVDQPDKTYLVRRVD